MKVTLNALVFLSMEAKTENVSQERETTSGHLSEMLENLGVHADLFFRLVVDDPKRTQTPCLNEFMNLIFPFVKAELGSARGRPIGIDVIGRILPAAPQHTMMQSITLFEVETEVSNHGVPLLSIDRFGVKNGL
jgi:hypothetical protein